MASKQMEELLAAARSLLPDYTTCRRCHRPLWGPLSVDRGIGPGCELRELVEKARQRGPQPMGRVIEFRGKRRRVKEADEKERAQ